VEILRNANNWKTGLKASDFPLAAAWFAGGVFNPTERFESRGKLEKAPE